MNEVQAVTSMESIDTVSELLLKHGSQDYVDIWKLGINVALRISDLVGLKFEDIDLNRDRLILNEGKTGKKREVRLNERALEIILRRRAANEDDTFIFQSHANRARSAKKPLDRSTVCRKFAEVGKVVKIDLGTHSMRKTRGYIMYSKGVPLAQICKLLNHRSEAETLRYIGITKEQTLATYDEFVL